MRIIDKGHTYALRVLDGVEEVVLTFVKHVGKKFPGNDGEPYPGTTNQEVLRALIDRTKYVNNQMYDARNQLAIDYMRKTLFLFEQRAASMHGCNLISVPRDIENCRVTKNGHLQQFWVSKETK